MLLGGFLMDDLLVSVDLWFGLLKYMNLLNWLVNICKYEFGFCLKEAHFRSICGVYKWMGGMCREFICQRVSDYYTKRA